MKTAHIFEIKEAENYTDDEYLLLHIACYLLNKPLGQPIKLSRTDLVRIIEFLKQAETGFSFEWDWVKICFRMKLPIGAATMNFRSFADTLPTT